MHFHLRRYTLADIDTHQWKLLVQWLLKIGLGILKINNTKFTLVGSEITCHGIGIGNVLTL